MVQPGKKKINRSPIRKLIINGRRKPRKKLLSETIKKELDLNIHFEDLVFNNPISSPGKKTLDIPSSETKTFDVI